MTKARPQLFKHNFAMRMLRWMLQVGATTQREFMAEYRRIGAAGTSFGDDFHRYTTTTAKVEPRRVIHKVGGGRPRLRWVGPNIEEWLAATPDDELQLGYETMERAMVETNDDHFRAWLELLRAEIDRRAR